MKYLQKKSFLFLFGVLVRRSLWPLYIAYKYIHTCQSDFLHSCSTHWYLSSRCDLSYDRRTEGYQFKLAWLSWGWSQAIPIRKGLCTRPNRTKATVILTLVLISIRAEKPTRRSRIAKTKKRIVSYVHITIIKWRQQVIKTDKQASKQKNINNTLLINIF